MGRLGHVHRTTAHYHAPHATDPEHISPHQILPIPTRQSRRGRGRWRHRPWRSHRLRHRLSATAGCRCQPVADRFSVTDGKPYRATDSHAVADS